MKIKGKITVVAIISLTAVAGALFLKYGVPTKVVEKPKQEQVKPPKPKAKEEKEELNVLNLTQREKELLILAQELAEKKAKKEQKKEKKNDAIKKKIPKKFLMKLAKWGIIHYFFFPVSIFVQIYFFGRPLFNDIFGFLGWVVKKTFSAAKKGTELVDKGNSNILQEILSFASKGFNVFGLVLGILHAIGVAAAITYITIKVWNFVEYTLKPFAALLISFFILGWLKFTKTYYEKVFFFLPQGFYRATRIEVPQKAFLGGIDWCIQKVEDVLANRSREENLNVDAPADEDMTDIRTRFYEDRTLSQMLYDANENEQQDDRQAKIDRLATIDNPLGLKNYESHLEVGDYEQGPFGSIKKGLTKVYHMDEELPITDVYLGHPQREKDKIEDKKDIEQVKDGGKKEEKKKDKSGKNKKEDNKVVPKKNENDAVKTEDKGEEDPDAIENKNIKESGGKFHLAKKDVKDIEVNLEPTNPLNATKKQESIQSNNGKNTFRKFNKSDSNQATIHFGEKLEKREVPKLKPIGVAQLEDHFQFIGKDDVKNEYVLMGQRIKGEFFEFSPNGKICAYRDEKTGYLNIATTTRILKGGTPFKEKIFPYFFRFKTNEKGECGYYKNKKQFIKYSFSQNYRILPIYYEFNNKGEVFDRKPKNWKKGLDAIKFSHKDIRKFVNIFAYYLARTANGEKYADPSYYIAYHTSFLGLLKLYVIWGEEYTLDICKIIAEKIFSPLYPLNKNFEELYCKGYTYATDFARAYLLSYEYANQFGNNDRFSKSDPNEFGYYFSNSFVDPNIFVKNLDSFKERTKAYAFGYAAKNFKNYSKKSNYEIEFSLNFAIAFAKAKLETFTQADDGYQYIDINLIKDIHALEYFFLPEHIRFLHHPCL